MQFIMGGTLFHAEDLPQSINEAFLSLHSAYLGNGICNLNNFKEVAHQFFNDPQIDFHSHDKFFNNFTIIWQQFLNNGQYDKAEEIWDLAVIIARRWEEQNHGKLIHKGTPFYFWGMTAILRGDLDKGYVLMHRALEEDVRTHNNYFPDTPGFAFATLNATRGDQAFRSWVLNQTHFISDQITAYCSGHGRKFDTDQFQKRYLFYPPNIDTIYLFAYTLARLLQLDKTPEFALQSNFAGQLEMNLLFDISLVIDSTIKFKNNKEWQFIDHISFLSCKGKFGIDKSKFIEINCKFKDDFDGTLKVILNGIFQFNDKTSLSKAGVDLAVTYGIRNHGAHNVTSASTIYLKFKEIRQRLFNTLFLAVEFLY